MRHLDVRTKVRMMAVCPSLVDTPLARGAFNINNEQKFSSNASEVGLRALLPSEVAEALAYLVVSGASGEVMIIIMMMMMSFRGQSQQIC